MAFNLVRTSARSLFSPSALSLARPVPSLLVSPSFRSLSTEARSKIDGAITKHPVVLFMKGTPDLPQCGFSRAVCQILEVQGVDGFASFNCLEDPELREGIKEFSSWPTIPQLYVKGEFIGGCDIVLAMHQNGELEKLFVDAGVVEPISALPDAPPS